jgi:hypothetical protein
MLNENYLITKRGNERKHKFLVVILAAVIKCKAKILRSGSGYQSIGYETL